jgi:hypothetical protein
MYQWMHEVIFSFVMIFYVILSPTEFSTPVRQSATVLFRCLQNHGRTQKSHRHFPPLDRSSEALVILLEPFLLRSLVGLCDNSSASTAFVLALADGTSSCQIELDDLRYHIQLRMNKVRQWCLILLPYLVCMSYSLLATR